MDFNAPCIVTVPEKKLVGIYVTMSHTNNRTSELWRSFMPLKPQIKNQWSSDMISLHIYPENFFSSFDPDQEFSRWACTEVTNLNQVPEGLDTLIVPSGQYAVFFYKGSSSDTRIFQHIFSEWLPNSGYILDNRPHFEILGDKYRNNDPESEEDIYIPIRIR